MLGCIAFTLVCSLAVNLEPIKDIQHTEIEREQENALFVEVGNLCD